MVFFKREKKILQKMGYIKDQQGIYNRFVNSV